MLRAWAMGLRVADCNRENKDLKGHCQAGCTWPRSHGYSLRWMWPLILCLTIWSANKNGRGRWDNREVVRR